MKNIPDITGDIGPLFTGPVKVPMYSFSRPAWLFWQGLYEGLREEGYSHERAIEMLQSKKVRHMLDGEGKRLERLGKNMAATLLS